MQRVSFVERLRRLDQLYLLCPVPDVVQWKSSVCFYQRGGSPQGALVYWREVYQGLIWSSLEFNRHLLQFYCLKHGLKYKPFLRCVNLTTSLSEFVLFPNDAGTNRIILTWRRKKKKTKPAAAGVMFLTRQWWSSSGSFLRKLERSPQSEGQLHLLQDELKINLGASGSCSRTRPSDY